MNKPFAIKFGDNDFYNTFIPLMRALAESEFDGTKDQLVDLINETAYSFYCIYQHGRVPDPAVHRTCIQYGIRDYLKVKIHRVFYGQDEVDGFFKDPEKIGTADLDFFYWYPGQGEPNVL